MGLLSLFSKTAPDLLKIPSGSFTVDRQGTLIATTLPSTFPPDLLDAVARQILACFREGAQAKLPFSELLIQYPSLKITAREMRGGAVIFLSPRSSFAS